MNTTPTKLFCDRLPTHNGGTWLAHFFRNMLGTLVCRTEEEKRKPVLVAEVSEGTNTPESYWAWWDVKDQQFMFVYPKRFLVDMCFPYGAKAEEERGRGKLLPVNVKILGEVKPNDKPNR